VIRLVVLAAIVVLLGSLLLSNINDTRASIDAIPDDEVTSNASDSRDSNSYSSTTITITMYAVADE